MGSLLNSHINYKLNYLLKKEKKNYFQYYKKIIIF